MESVGDFFDFTCVCESWHGGAVNGMFFMNPEGLLCDQLCGFAASASAARRPWAVGMDWLRDEKGKRLLINAVEGLRHRFSFDRVQRGFDCRLSETASII